MTCGECKHAVEKSHSTIYCKAVVPMWVQGPRWVLKDEDATPCPCFERKEEK